MDYDRKCDEFCRKINFDERYARNLYNLVKLNNGEITGGVLRAHFPIGWAGCVRIAEEMDKNGLAKFVDEIEGGAKWLPPEEVLGWGKSEENKVGKEEHLRKFIESNFGVGCDWQITPEDKEDSDCSGVITDNLHLAAIKLVLECNKGSRGLFKRRLAISFVLADELANILVQDGVLVLDPVYRENAPWLVNRELGEKLCEQYEV